MALRLEQEKDIPLFLLLGTILFFFLLTYDAQYSIVFITLAFLNLFFYHSYSSWRFPIGWKAKRKLKIFATAAGAYGLFLVVSVLVGGALNLATDMGSIMRVFAQQPVLYANLFIGIMAFAIIVPILESDFFFGRLMEVISRYFKINLAWRLTNPNIWVTAGLMAGFFTIFHVASKLSDLTAGLTYVFIFGFISVMVVLKTRRTADAIVMHVYANLLAVLVNAGVIFAVAATAAPV